MRATYDSSGDGRSTSRIGALLPYSKRWAGRKSAGERQIGALRTLAGQVIRVTHSYPLTARRGVSGG